MLRRILGWGRVEGWSEKLTLWGSLSSRLPREVWKALCLLILGVGKAVPRKQPKTGTRMNSESDGLFSPYNFLAS